MMPTLKKITLKGIFLINYTVLSGCEISLFKIPQIVQLMLTNEIRVLGKETVVLLSICFDWNFLPVTFIAFYQNFVIHDLVKEI